MARKKKTWTPKQGKWQPDAMAGAYTAVTEGRLGIREAAKLYPNQPCQEGSARGYRVPCQLQDHRFSVWPMRMNLYATS